MNKLSIYLIVSFIVFGCNKSEKLVITEIGTTYQHSLRKDHYSVNIILENDEAVVHAFYGPTIEHNSNNSVVKKMFRIPKKEFNRIRDLVKSINEKNIRNKLNRSGLDGSTTTLKFGDGINFKQYAIWSPELHKGESLKKYMELNKEIFKLGGFDPDVIYSL